MGYSIVNVDELEGAGPGGAVRFVRRALGVEAFGINWFDLPPDSEGREHDETGTGQEEVNIIVRGSGVVPDRRRRGAVRGARGVPLRPRDGSPAGRRARRADDDRRRRAPRQLRAARAVLDGRPPGSLEPRRLGDRRRDRCARTCGTSRRAFSEVEGLLFKAWISDANSDRWGAFYVFESREAAEQPLPSRARELIGKDPDLVEIFDLEATVSIAPQLKYLGLAFAT